MTGRKNKMKLLILLSLFTLPSIAHNNIISIGGDLNGTATLSYHQLHFERNTLGYYGNIAYKDNSTTKQSSIDKIISELVTTTEELTTSTYHRATKCNKKGKCHEYGPSIETTTTEIVTTDNWVDRTETITTNHKKNVKTYIINAGVSYAVHDTVFVYAGPGIALKGSNKQFNGNIGVMYNSGSFGADLGFNTSTDKFTLGFSFVF